MPFSTDVKCDVCLGQVSPDQGYLVSTASIVSSPKFWNSYYELHAKELEALNVRSYEEFCRSQPVYLTCERLAAEPTPWLVCDQCVSKFDIDRELSMQHAHTWWKSAGTFRPPGTGPADVSMINMGDGRSWTSINKHFEKTDAETGRKWWQLWK